MKANERWTVACFSLATDKLVDELPVPGNAETFRRIFKRPSVDDMLGFDHVITDTQRAALEALLGRSIPTEGVQCVLGVTAIDE